jgi:hypothetical protein
MSGRAADDCDTEAPATLHRVMQAAISHGLHEHYKVQRHMPHGLFVLLMQMNQQAPVAKLTRRASPKSRRRSSPLAKQVSKLPSVAPTA